MNVVASLITQIALTAFQHRGQSKPMWASFLGVFFLVLGGGFGGYFIFHFLVPLIGYIETGMLFSVFFIACGLSIFLFRPKKKADPVAQALSSAKNVVDKIDVSELIQKHSGKIMIGAVLMGAVLSQFLSAKNASASDDKESEE